MRWTATTPLKALVFFVWLCLGAAIVRKGTPARVGPAEQPGARRRELRALVRRVGRSWAWRCSASGPGPARRGRRSPVPAWSLERLATGPLLRVALVLAWMWAGWHLFAR